MKDTARDPDFCVVARVEALIAGWPLEEALRRADAYLAAGELKFTCFHLDCLHSVFDCRPTRERL